MKKGFIINTTLRLLTDFAQFEESKLNVSWGWCFFVCNSALCLEISLIEENNGLSLEKTIEVIYYLYFFPLLELLKRLFIIEFSKAEK